MLSRIAGWWNDRSPGLARDATPAGYAWMVTQRALAVMPHHRWSFVGRVGARHTHEFQGTTWETFPQSYAPEDVVGHLEFALKYDGINLEILRAWFEAFEASDVGRLEAWVREAPTSTYARRAWYLYELLTARTLDLPDAASGPYAPVLDADRHFHASPTRVRRDHPHGAGRAGGDAGQRPGAVVSRHPLREVTS